jgi:hypothetical protein
MPAALIAAIMVADFPVHPPRLPIVFAVAVTRDFILGHESSSFSCVGAKTALRGDSFVHTYY